jgi:hypothetical protein
MEAAIDEAALSVSLAVHSVSLVVVDERVPRAADADASDKICAYVYRSSFT